MTYSLIDAMKDELEFLRTELSISEKEQPKAFMYHTVLRINIKSLKRTIERYEKGYEFYFTKDKNGETVYTHNKTTRHLERDHSEVREARENYDDVAKQAEVYRKLGGGKT